jgi:hypothetical protein
MSDREMPSGPDAAEELARRLEALSAEVRDLARRMAALEDRPASPAPSPDRLRPDPPRDEAVPRPVLTTIGTLSELGRFFLILCGAFLLRHVTGAALLPTGVGVGLGLAYAVLWLALADRAAAHGRRLAAVLDATAFAAIAMPLTWEATIRFGVLTPPTASGVLLALAGLALVVAVRRDVRGIAIVTVPVVLVTAFVVAVATRDLVSAASAMLVLGVVGVWLAGSMGWTLTRWFAAGVVDVLILQAVLLLARPAGPPEPYAGLAPGGVAAIAIALPIAYLASFLAAAVLLGSRWGAFEVLQGAAATLIGLPGAHRALAGVDGSNQVVGWLALGSALAVLASAYVVSSIRSDERRFSLLVAWSTATFLWATAVVLPTPVPTLAWCVAGVAAAAVGSGAGRVVLHAAAAALIGAASIGSGLLGWSARVLAGPAGGRSGVDLAVLACLAAATGASAVMTVDPRAGTPERRLSGAVRLVVGTIVLVGSAAAATASLVAALSLVTDPDAAVVGVVRTAVLTGSTFVLALLGRRSHHRHWSWLVYPVLAAAGLKILVDDLPHGRPVTLFVDFALYGLALIVVPGMLRGRSPSPPESSRSNPPDGI